MTRFYLLVGEGELKLTVTTVATTSVAWFSTPTGGEAIGSGNSFTIPSVYETTTSVSAVSPVSGTLWRGNR